MQSELAVNLAHTFAIGGVKMKREVTMEQRCFTKGRWDGKVPLGHFGSTTKVAKQVQVL